MKTIKEAQLLDYFYLLLLSSIWGSAFVAISFALTDSAPYIIAFGRIFMAALFLSMIAAIKKIPFIPIVLIGEKYYKKKLVTYAHGFQHAYFSLKLNSELVAMLSKNGGGVCVSKRFLTKDLIAFNRSHNIKTTVFSAEDRKEYKKLASYGADIIFCDFIDSKVLSV